MTTPSLSNSAPEKVSDNARKRSWFGWWWNWMVPRSENRDEAFRERTIRITVAVLLVLTGAEILSAVLYTSTNEIITYPNLSLVVAIIWFGSAVAVSRQKVLLAGQLLVLGLVIGAAGVTVIDRYWGFLSISTFMLVVLITSLTLPRIWLSYSMVASILLYSLIAYSQYAAGMHQPIGEFSDRDFMFASIINITFMLLVETFFLNRLRVEFDERLAAERVSYNQAEEARREADRANQAKSRFLASMSHEFRTPLNAIIGYIDIMLTGMAGDSPDQRNRMHSHIRDNATRLLSSINDTLDMARIESGRVRVDVVELIPHQVIDNIVGSMNSLAHKKDIYLKAEYSDDVPETVVCDKTKLQQVLTNLIGNALKFTNEGGVTVSVSGAGEGQWRFTVTDTGIGMPEDAGNYVFESFRQVEDSDRRKYEGTGLGLAITKRWVTLMDGTIELKTAPGQGSSFIVTLPLVVEEREAPETVTHDRRSVIAAS